MRLCKHAKPEGRPCDDETSKLITCQVDGVIRCLKECMRSCPPGEYCPVDEPEPPVRTERRQTTLLSGASGHGKPCGGGGGCGENKPQGYTQAGQNISYGNAGQNISYS
jgi:hypothetical protein